MTSVALPSALPYKHRVTGPTPELLTCRCHRRGVIEHDPTHAFPWSVRCPGNGRPSHRGTSGKAAFGLTERAAMLAWNRQQSAVMMGPRKHHVVIEVDTRVRCPKCGLAEPHVCLFAHGFQRLSSHGDASGRFKSAP